MKESEYRRDQVTKLVAEVRQLRLVASAADALADEAEHMVWLVDNGAPPRDAGDLNGAAKRYREARS